MENVPSSKGGSKVNLTHFTVQKGRKHFPNQSQWGPGLALVESARTSAHWLNLGHQNKSELKTTEK